MENDDDGEQYYDDEEEDTPSSNPMSSYGSNGGEQSINHMVHLFRQQLVNQMKDPDISSKRQKGKAPSREHPSHEGQQQRRRIPAAPPGDDIRKDPNYIVDCSMNMKSRGRGSSRGRGRGRGLGRGRGRGKAADQSKNKSELGSRGMHWRKPELRALIFGANHLKPVLKGKFKHSNDGKTMKKLAWEELSGK